MANVHTWSRRMLSVCPVLIAVLWVAGVSRFRGYALTGPEWAVVVAAAFALHTLTAIAGRRRPMPQLPEGSNPVTVSLLAAAILGVVAAIVAAVFEAIVDEYRPSDVALARCISEDVGDDPDRDARFRAPRLRRAARVVAASPARVCGNSLLTPETSSAAEGLD